MKLPPENVGNPTPEVTTVYKRAAVTESKTSETLKTEMIPPRELRSSKRKRSISVCHTRNQHSCRLSSHFLDASLKLKFHIFGMVTYKYLKALADIDHFT